MWRRTSPAALLFAVLLILALGWPMAANAAEPQLRLTGRAQVVQDGQVQRLLLSADSSDSGWRLRTALTPTAARGELESREREATGSRETDDARVARVPLAGAFTLDGPNGASLTGQASGTLDSRSGNLRLARAAGGDALTANFTLGSSGELTLDLTGALPANPAAPTVAPTTASVSAPAPTASSTAATSNDPTVWYIARASGLTAYMLLFVQVVLGLAVKMRFLDDIFARWRSLDLHKFTAFLGLGFLGLHLAALLADRLMQFQVIELLVPFASSYRPLPVAAGTIAFYAMVLLAVSIFIRDQIGYSVWRALHYASFGAFVLVLAHGIFAGTDASQVWARLIYWGTGTIVGLLLIQRFLIREPRQASAG